jgi:F5/8 type C domain
MRAWGRARVWGRGWAVGWVVGVWLVAGLAPGRVQAVAEGTGAAVAAQGQEGEFSAARARAPVGDDSAAAPAGAQVRGESAAAPDSGVQVLDDFTTGSLAGWEAAPAEGVKLALGVCGECGRAGAGGGGARGGALRLEFDFQGHGGYAIARKRIGLELPENYEFSFWIRGEAPRNNLEFKLLDRGDGKGGGESVWWVVRRELEFPREWQRVVVKKRHLGFAWGPAGGGEIRHAAALEIVVSAGQGGRGVVEIAELGFAALPPPHPYAGRPVASASSAAPGGQAGGAVDGDVRTEWHSVGAAGEEQWLAVDFGERRELGGLVIDWDRDDFATRFTVLTSGDGTAWTASRKVERPGSGTSGTAGAANTAAAANTSAAADMGIGPAKSYLYLPDTDARYLRLELRTSSRGRG